MTEDQKLEYVRKLVQICSNAKSTDAKYQQDMSKILNVFAEDMKKNFQNVYWITEKIAELTKSGLSFGGLKLSDYGDDLYGSGLLNPFLKPDKARLANEVLEIGAKFSKWGSKISGVGQVLGKAMPAISLVTSTATHLSEGDSLGKAVG